MKVLQLAHRFQEFDLGLYKIVSYNSINLKTKKNPTISLLL